MPRIIEVIVSPTGETTLQTKGYAGSECQQASRFLEQTLGVSSVEIKTADYYLESPAQTEQHTGQ